MAVEAIRGCGYRIVGGTYLVCPPNMFHIGCDRLPYALRPCPTCGEGVHLTRSLRRIDPVHMFPKHEISDKYTEVAGIRVMVEKACVEGYPWCPLCHPKDPIGFTMGVGETFYTPRSFVDEARLIGVSKRIPVVPRNFEVGKTWIYLLHQNACGTKKPGIFSAFRPMAVEQLFWESQKSDKLIAELKKKHIDPVWIPDGDTDHAPKSDDGSGNAGGDEGGAEE